MQTWYFMILKESFFAVVRSWIWLLFPVNEQCTHVIVVSTVVKSNLTFLSRAQKWARISNCSCLFFWDEELFFSFCSLDKRFVCDFTDPDSTPSWSSYLVEITWNTFTFEACRQRGAMNRASTSSRKSASSTRWPFLCMSHWDSDASDSNCGLRPHQPLLCSSCLRWVELVLLCIFLALLVNGGFSIAESGDKLFKNSWHSLYFILSFL